MKLLDLTQTMTETDFRKLIQATFESLERACESVDPDLVECIQSQGSLTLVFGAGAKCILSVQPSVRQLWLAHAAEGKAWHLQYDSALQDWVDDKGQGLNLRSLIRNIFATQAKGVAIEF